MTKGIKNVKSNIHKICNFLIKLSNDNIGFYWRLTNYNDDELTITIHYKKVSRVIYLLNPIDSFNTKYTFKDITCIKNEIIRFINHINDKK